MRLPILALAGSIAAVTVAQDYVPFPVSGAEWIVQRTAAGGSGGKTSISFSSYTLAGDTAVNDTVYHKVHERMGYAPGIATLVAGLREEGKKVYVRRLGYNGLPGACQSDPSFETLLYDFNLDAPGDSLIIQHPWIGEVVFRVTSIDSVNVNSAPRRRINCENLSFSCGPLPFTYIEGVGSERHLFDPFMQQTYEINYLLSCFKMDEAFHYSAFVTPPLCDIISVGMDQAPGTPEWSVHQANGVLVIDNADADRIRVMDALGRIVNEIPIANGRAIVPLDGSTGTLWFLPLRSQRAVDRAIPVVIAP